MTDVMNRPDLSDATPEDPPRVRTWARWAQLIRTAFRESAASLRHNPGLAVATTITIALTVALAGAGVLTRSAVDAVSSRWADGVEFVVYLQPDASSSDTERIRDQLEGSSSVQRIDRVTQAEAFEEFTTMYAEEAAVVESVTPELLPSSFKVSPTEADPATIAEVADPLRADPAVYQVVTADDAIRDVRDLTSTAAAASLALTVVLAAAAVVLCAAMIRTSIAARRDEIAVMRLVGASRSFISSSLALEGIVCAAVGAVLAGATLLVATSVAAGSESRVLAALIPPPSPSTTTSVLAVVAVSVVAAAALTLGTAALTLRRTR
jgi:cell division transport system permease protein